MKRILFVIAGIIALLVGAGLIMPAAAKWQQSGPEGPMVMGPLILGVVIVIAGLTSLVRAVISRRA